MRIDKPIGFYLLFWPVLWAFLVSAEGSPNLYYLLIFIFGVIATRSAGCVINDYFDQKIDKKVENGMLPASEASKIISESKSSSSCFL